MNTIGFLQKPLTREFSEKGMTLVEILAVIVLLSLIMGIVAQGIFGKGEDAKAKANIIRMKKIQSALGQYRLEFNSYPASLDGLINPTSEVKKQGALFTPFVDTEELKDVWNGDYIYKQTANGRSYELTTLGSDGKAGGTGADSDVTVTP